VCSVRHSCVPFVIPPEPFSSRQGMLSAKAGIQSCHPSCRPLYASIRSVMLVTSTPSAVCVKTAGNHPLQTSKLGVVMAYNQNRITSTDNVKVDAELAWKEVCGAFGYYQVLTGDIADAQRSGRPARRAMSSWTWQTAW